MTSTDRFPAAGARFSPPTPSLASSRTAGPYAGRLLSGASRGTTLSVFAAHMEHLLKEDCAGRKADPFSSSAATAPGAGTEADAGTACGEGRVRDEAMSAESENSDDGAPSAPDDDAVGRGATLDSMLQVLGALAPRTPPPSAPAKAEHAMPPDVRPGVEQLMARLVRRVAWSGNGRTGVARLELGAGELEGATLVIQADDGVVRVALDLPPGVDRTAWKERISHRLALRGLQVEAVEVG